MSAVPASLLPAWPSVLSSGLLVSLLYLVRRSLPFSWHIRVLSPYFAARWTARWRASSKAKSGRAAVQGEPGLCLDALPLGKDPFQDVHSMHFQATIDECDFMGHLSNSSYPKNLDIARSHYATRCLLLFSSDGGWIALGSVSFKFLREIPLWSRYEIRCSIQTWDEKWLYLKNEFITRSAGGEEVLHCVSISKHCCKVGRKTIPPWFALAYSGYSSPSCADPMDNWKRSQSLRLRLQKTSRRNNPIKAIKPVKDDRDVAEEEWMSPEAWNVAGWKERCSTRKEELLQYYH